MCSFNLNALEQSKLTKRCGEQTGPCLLEVGGEAMHVLVVGQHDVSLGMEEVDIPDAQ